MLEPSPSAIVQLNRLIRVPRASLVDRLLGREATVVRTLIPADAATIASALSALVETRDWRALPYIGWLLATDAAREPVIECIRNLLPVVGDSLERLDTGMREESWQQPEWWPPGEPFPGVPSLDVAQAFPLLRSFSGDVAIAGYLSFCPSGYVREIAVGALAESYCGRELPFLLLRTNDWVEPVARIAMRASSARLRPGYESHFAEQLALVARMRERRRWDHSAFVTLVERFLSDTADSRRALVDAFGRGNRGLRRACADVVRRCFPVLDGLSRPELSSFLRDPDPVVRLRALDAIERLSSDDDVASWVEQLRTDRSATIRQRVWTLVEHRLPATADKLASEFLFDRNAWLREFARQRLGRLGVRDFAAQYRDAVRSGFHLEGAVLGLMDTGTKDDALLVTPLIDARASRVRRAALLAATSLDQDAAAATLIRVLASGSAGLARIAAARLTALRVFVSTDEIEPLFGGPVPQVRAHALRILRTRDRWAALIWALRLRRESDPSIKRCVRRVLSEWRHLPASLYVEPSASQRAELVSALSTLGDEPSVRDTLRRLLLV